MGGAILYFVHHGWFSGTDLLRNTLASLLCRFSHKPLPLSGSATFLASQSQQLAHECNELTDLLHCLSVDIKSHKKKVTTRKSQYNWSDDDWI